MVLPKMVDHTFIRTILAVVLHRKDPKQYLLINMNLHFKKKVVAVFPLWFLFPIQMRCTDRRIWKSYSSYCLKINFVVSMINIVTTAGRWFTSHFFSIFGKLFCLELDSEDWFIQLGISFFSAQLPLSEKSISWQCKASFALVYNTRI